MDLSAAEKKKSEAILKKLHEVGKRGAFKSKLAGSGKAFTVALDELVKSEKVFRPTEKCGALYYLKSHMPDTASVAGELSQLLGNRKVDLITLSEIEKKVKGVKKKELVEEAVKKLISDGLIFELRSKTKHFLYLPVLDNERGLKVPKLEILPNDGNAADAVHSAYRKLKSQSDFSAVAISDLARESGLALATAKEILIREAIEQRAVLSVGDWSVADEDTRAGSIEMNGKKYLHVRF